MELHMATKRIKRAEFETQLAIQQAHIVAQEARLASLSFEISMMRRSFWKRMEPVVEEKEEENLGDEEMNGDQVSQFFYVLYLTMIF